MQKPRILDITDSAENDLLTIWGFIALDSPRQADKFIDDLTHHLEALLDFPELGPERPLLGKDIRAFFYGRYVVYYTITKTCIAILRVLHSARDSAARGP